MRFCEFDWPTVSEMDNRSDSSENNWLEMQNLDSDGNDCSKLLNQTAETVLQEPHLLSRALLKPAPLPSQHA
jgi:hypothetical protein